MQKDKQRSTKHTYKAKARVTRTPLKTGGELGCSEMVSSSCSTSDTCRVNLATQSETRLTPTATQLQRKHKNAIQINFHSTRQHIVIKMNDNIYTWTVPWQGQ
jgi:hypothetical protein